MNVKQLIEELQKHPDYMTVLLSDYLCDLDDVEVRINYRGLSSPVVVLSSVELSEAIARLEDNQQDD